MELPSQNFQKLQWLLPKKTTMILYCRTHSWNFYGKQNFN